MRGNVHAQSGEGNVETRLWQHSKVRYVSTLHVIERANEIFSFVWSFELVKEPMIMRWQKTQTYYSQQHRRKMPVLDDQGKPVTEEVGMVWVTGKVRSLILTRSIHSHWVQ